MKTAIYELKRKFGKRAFVRLENQTVDRESGEVSQEVEELEIRHLIILPLRHSWDNAQFTRSITRTNAAYQTGDREFLIDRLDLDKLSTKHVIVVDDKRFHVIAFDEYDDCFYAVGRNESQLA